MKELRRLNPIEAKLTLIKLLQSAHAGEKAAANAYYGHAQSLFVKSEKEKKEILDIYKDELHHRKRLGEMLIELKASPKPLKEFLMYTVGFVIGFLCLFGGWFIPMYGAGKLESENVEEYEVAARLALLAGLSHLIDEFLVFAEVEWDHELYFRRKAQSHRLSQTFSLWKKPKARESIRKNFETFQNHSYSYK